MFLEKNIHYIIAGLMTGLVCFLGIEPNRFLNFKDILASSINVSAITAGFLATAMSLLITLTNETVIQRLRDFGLYIHLINYLKSAIGWTFFIAIVSAACLFIDGNGNTKYIFFLIWIFFCVAGAVSVIRVVNILSKILDKMSG
ncbi:hypothetical protein [Paenibacillus sp. BT-177]|uniref:hypothetical protein n=1 Tax=Paenibacillus sp. BT-177 TaxID=2986930 RepID=UPI0021F7FE7C|nr:hypothetical protein [Paenibacillus sp. BT-177]